MLNEQKRAFAHALMSGATQKQAAIDAGYSPHTAKVRGCQLAKDKAVKTYIAAVESGKAPKQRANLDEISDPLTVLRVIMTENEHTDPRLALKAAVALAPFEHSRLS